MNTLVFESKDYRKYLSHWIESKPHRGRGLRSSLAEAMGCQTAYVTQVLQGKANLSLEQADLANEFLGHSEEESQYFLLLVQYERAGTARLKKHFFGELNKIQQKRLSLADRLKQVSRLDSENQSRYYSSWHYAAVHILVTIPGIQTKEAISEHLGLSIKKASEILEFLVSVGLLQLQAGKYTTGSVFIHLGVDSALISKHHTNWRIQAIKSLETPTETDFHYSLTMTLSNADLVKIKSMLVDTVERVREIVKDSKEEAIHCLALDFFDLKFR